MPSRKSLPLWLQLLRGDRNSKLVPQFRGRLASFRDHERTVFDMLENPLGLFAIASRDFLQFGGHRKRVAGHHLALLDTFDQINAHRLDLFCGRFIFAKHGFRRQLADFGSSVTVLDIIGHCRFGRADRWRSNGHTWFLQGLPVLDFRTDFTLDVGWLHSSRWLNHDSYSLSPRNSRGSQC